ncbi:nuclease A inhibitor family protein [Pontibacter litorisediminis]|uniref:nuclease A inhibitor family protein n=1 Tax=Pontibacter litorisediminis TaxID=1846260 RepID=UPI0023EAD93B|nr:nuclease A inhibitor family protein [Pontibacter litorisediminis]
MNKAQLERELMQAVDGLLLQSEIEAPFEFVFVELPQGQQLKPDDVVEHAGKPSGMAVKIQTLEEFFSQLQGLGSDVRESTPEGKAAYQELTDTLQRLLQDIKVYSITQIGTEAYILGKADDSNYAGLRTMLIQDEATVKEEE